MNSTNPKPNRSGRFWRSLTAGGLMAVKKSQTRQKLHQTEGFEYIFILMRLHRFDGRLAICLGFSRASHFRVSLSLSLSQTLMVSPSPSPPLTSSLAPITLLSPLSHLCLFSLSHDLTLTLTLTLTG